MNFHLFLAMLALVAIVEAMPKPSGGVRNVRAARPKFDLSDAAKYLNSYGYMSKSSTSAALAEIETLDSISLSKPIRQFQRMAGIKVTGELDEETLKYMSLNRCGVEDSVGNFDAFGIKAYKVRSGYVSRGSRRRNRKNKRRPGEKSKSRTKRYNLQGSKWSKTALTYTIKNYTPDMQKAHVRSAISRALQLWADSANLKFRETSSGDADIKISFGSNSHGDSYPFDGRGGTLAHAFFPSSGEAHFDDDEYFSNEGEGTNLFIVAAHEFGHSLGLGHSSVQNSLMAPFYQGYVADYTLHPDDVAAIQRLYGKNVDDKAERPDKPIGRPTDPPRSRPTKKPRTNLPDICTTDLDAAMEYRDRRSFATYVFKRSYFYRLNDYGVVSGYPKKIGQHWKGLPGSLNAAVHSARTGCSYFFKGDKMYSYYGTRLRPGFPIKSSVMGLPSYPTAALSWGNDGKIYIFKKNKYYIFDEYSQETPRSKPITDVWKNVPLGIDAAITWTRNGRTYFFKGNEYWRFDNRKGQVDAGYPQNLNVKWLGCESGNRGDGNTAKLSRKDKNVRRRPRPGKRGGRRRAESHVLARLVERVGNGTKIA